MITFNVVKERYGWAIRMNERMMTPFWSRDMAIRQANCLADAIRRHGECAEVIVEGADPAGGLKRSRVPQTRLGSTPLLPGDAGRVRSDVAGAGPR